MEYTHEFGLLFSNPILAIIVLSIITAVIMRWPEFGVASFFPLPIIQGISFNLLFFNGIRLDEILLFILFFKLLYLHVNQQRYDKLFLLNPLIISALILVGLVLLQPILTADPKLLPFILQQTEKIIIPLIGVLIISRDIHRLKRLIGFLFGLLLVFNFAFLITVISALDRYTLSQMRHLLFLRTPIWYSGANLLLFMALIFLFFKSSNKIYNIIVLSAISVSILFVILGQTRGVWISTIVGITYLLFKSFKIKRIKKLGYIILVILCISSFFPADWGNIKSESSKIFLTRYEKTFVDLSLIDSYGSRMNLWKNSWDAFLSSPIWGVGHYRAAWGDRANPYAPRMSVHNEVLATLSEQGIIGFLILIVFLYRVLIVVRMNHKIQQDDEDIFILNILGITMLLSSIIVFQISYWGAAFVFSSYLQYRANQIHHVNYTKSYTAISRITQYDMNIAQTNKV